MLRRGDIIELVIKEYAFGGKGIGHISIDETEFTIFVENTFPGQHVIARIFKIRKKYAEAKLISITNRSEVEVMNDLQEVSGGPYIFVPPQNQKEVKIKSTITTFEKILGDKIQVFDEYIESPELFFYRNKMEYSFSSIEYDVENKVDIDDAFALGFKHRGTWWKVESLNKPCGLFDESFEKKLPLIRKILESSNLPAWHPPQKKGFFRHLVVRKSFSKNEFLINLVTSSEGIDSFDPSAFIEILLNSFGDKIKGIIHTVNDDVSDRSKIENGYSKLLFGENRIIENINELNFHISMESFFQTNPKCAEKLYNKAIDYLLESHLNDEDVIMDLFCGTGTIGQLISKRNPSIKIIGVDIVLEAIQDAKDNAKSNGINSIKFYAEDVGKFLYNHPEYKDKINALILDPPRAGIAPKTLKKINELNAKTIVYISCNPATQARDALTLKEFGYNLDKFSLVNQFPHTGHIESIGKFVKS